MAKTASWWIKAENCNKLADNGGKVAEYLADKIKVFIFVARNG